MFPVVWDSSLAKDRPQATHIFGLGNSEDWCEYVLLFFFFGIRDKSLR